jgi:hypothetical protein
VMPALGHIGGMMHFSQNLSLAPSQVTALVTQVENRDGIEWGVLRYRNDPEEIIPSIEARYWCDDNQIDFPYVLEVVGADATLHEPDWSTGEIIASYVGNVVQDGTTLSLVFPDVGADAEPVLMPEWELEMLVAFYTEGWFGICYAVGGAPESGLAPAPLTYACPAQIGVTHTFVFGSDGDVRWDKNDDGDVLSVTGVYRVEEDAVHLAFGIFNDTQFFVGTLGPGSLHIPALSVTACALDE